MGERGINMGKPFGVIYPRGMSKGYTCPPPPPDSFVSLLNSPHLKLPSNSAFSFGFKVVQEICTKQTELLSLRSFSEPTGRDSNPTTNPGHQKGRRFARMPFPVSISRVRVVSANFVHNML